MKQLSTFTNKTVIQRQMTSKELASALSMKSSMVDQIFAMRFGSDSGSATMSLKQFVDFMLSNEQLASNLDAAKMRQLKFMQTIMNATVSGNSYNCGNMSKLFGMDSNMVKMLYTFYIAEKGNTSTWKVSLQTSINYIVNDLATKKEFSSMFNSNTLGQLKMLQEMINGTVAGTSYSSSKLSKILGMDSEQLNQLYLLYDSKYGNTSSWKMSIQKFVNFINSDILTDKKFSDSFSPDNAKDLKQQRL